MQPGLEDELAAVSEFTLLKVEGKQDVLLCSERRNVGSIKDPTHWDRARKIVAATSESDKKFKTESKPQRNRRNNNHLCSSEAVSTAVALLPRPPLPESNQPIRRLHSGKIRAFSSLI